MSNTILELIRHKYEEIEQYEDLDGFESDVYVDDVQNSDVQNNDVEMADETEPVEVTVNDAEGKPVTKKVRYISYVG